MDFKKLGLGLLATFALVSPSAMAHPSTSHTPIGHGSTVHAPIVRDLATAFVCADGLSEFFAEGGYSRIGHTTHGTVWQGFSPGFDFAEVGFYITSSNIQSLSFKTFGQNVSSFLPDVFYVYSVNGSFSTSTSGIQAVLGPNQVAHWKFNRANASLPAAARVVQFIYFDQSDLVYTDNASDIVVNNHSVPTTGGVDTESCFDEIIGVGN